MRILILTTYRTPVSQTQDAIAVTQSVVDNVSNQEYEDMKHLSGQYFNGRQDITVEMVPLTPPNKVLSAARLDRDGKEAKSPPLYATIAK